MEDPRQVDYKEKLAVAVEKAAKKPKKTKKAKK